MERAGTLLPGRRLGGLVGLSAYGAQTPADRPGDWEPFRASLDRVVPRLAAMAPGKPIFLFEFGATGNNPSASAPQFADDALTDLLGGRWPEIRGFSWWNETRPNDNDASHDTDMRVQTVPGLDDVFRTHLVGHDDVLSDPLP